MNKAITISIITVSYNSASTIEETINSVLSQDYPHIEYIVIDGNSNDGAQQILARYQQRIDIVISEPDRGIYDAMNKGIKMARGEIIGLLNADDLYANKEIISQVCNVFQNPTVEACYGDLIYFSSMTPHKIYRYWKSNPYQTGAFAKGWSPAHPTFFVRKEVYERCGYFNLDYSMGNDIELMMRFLAKHCISAVYIPQVLVKMRLGGVSNQTLGNVIQQNKNVLQAAKALGIPISPFKFIVAKLVNRISQFIIKPRSNSYVK